LNTLKWLEYFDDYTHTEEECLKKLSQLGKAAEERIAKGITEVLAKTKLSNELEDNLKTYASLKQLSHGSISVEGYKLLKKITTTLINLVDDEEKFSDAYSEFLAKEPDGTDFYLESLYEICKVKDADEFFAKYFPSKI
jgi:hypothetical protein